MVENNPNITFSLQRKSLELAIESMYYDHIDHDMSTIWRIIRSCRVIRYNEYEYLIIQKLNITNAFHQNSSYFQHQRKIRQKLSFLLIFE